MPLLNTICGLFNPLTYEPYAAIGVDGSVLRDFRARFIRVYGLLESETLAT
jgi:hypothetical protein